MNRKPILFLVSGFLMVLFGAVMPWLMVLQIVESTFFLNFLSFAASFTGLMFGIIGAANIAANYRNRHRDEDQYR